MRNDKLTSLLVRAEVLRNELVVSRTKLFRAFGPSGKGFQKALAKQAGRLRAMAVVRERLDEVEGRIARTRTG